jgi:hypothetical protein
VLGTDYPFAQEIGIATTVAGVEQHVEGDGVAAIESEVALRLFPRLDPGGRTGAGAAAPG